MRSAYRATALCGLVLSVGFSQTVPPTASQLEAFEHFAQRPTARITWSKEVGRIDTDRTHALFTALIVDDATQTPRQMRGLRIDLTDGKATEQFYTSDDLLDRLIQALDEITAGLPRFLSESHLRSCFGSGVFWNQEGHAFSASYCVFPDFEGLVVRSFRFSRAYPVLFAGAVTRGRDELNKQ